MNNVVLSYGYKKEDVIGKSLLEFIPEKHWPMISEHVADLAEGKSTQGEVKLKTKQGTVIAEFRSSPIKKRGKIIGFQSIVRDITDRKKAEKALKESEQKLRDFINTSPDAIVWIDTTGEITLVNRKVLEVTGFPEKHFIGRNFMDVKAVTQKSKMKILEKLMERLEGIDIPPYEVEVVTKNGEVLPFELSASPIFKEGKIVGIQSIWRDLRERKRAEEQLRESEERLRQLIEYAPDAIYINDLDGNFVDGNKQAEKMIGYKKEELIGKSMLEVGLVSEKSLLKIMADSEKNLRGQMSGPNEFELMRKDGSTVVVEASSIPVKREGKTEVIGIARNITERKKMEEKLRESEERFRNLYESIQDPVSIYVGREGHIIDYNKAFKKLSRYTDEELKDKIFLDFVHPDDHALVLERYGKKYSEEEFPLVYEIRAVNKKGEIIPLEISVSTYKKKGRVIGIEVIHRDITERKQMEEKLKESEERLRNLYESVPDALAVYVGREGSLIEYNKAFKKWVGYTAEELKDKIFLDFVHPDDHAMLIEKYRTKYSEEDLPLIYEIKGLNKKGEIIQTEISVGTYKRKGRVIGIEVMHRNITERKKMEKKLMEYSQHLEEMVKERTREVKESEAKLKDLFKTIPDSIAIVDINANLLEFNETTLELFGYSREVLIGRNIFDFIAEEDREKAARGIEQVLEKGFIRIQFLVLAKNGRKIPVELNASILKDLKENLMGFVAVLRDVTERKRMEEQLLRSERLAAIGQLATMVGHDLRNPLSAIQNACYYLKMKLGASKDEKIKKMFGIIDNEINYANNIIKDLLDFSKVKKPELKKVDLISSIQDAITHLKFPENITLTTKFSEAPAIEADLDQLRRIFQNIALNGIQAMPNGGELTVSTRKNGDFTEVAFTDTGVGIPEENIGKLFAPLFTTKAQGVGLGLSICKNLVEAHNGRVEVKSKVGEGSTFTVKLPIHQNKGGEKQV